MLRVVTSVAAGAPLGALALAVAPIAAAPLTPVVSVPVNDITVTDDTTGCDSVAVTATFESVAGANARQISAVPSGRAADLRLQG